MNSKLRTGDQVVVIAGNDRGKAGKVLSFMGEDRVVVEGVNVRKKHLKKTQTNQKGQIIDIEKPIHISNVKLAIDGKGVKLRTKHFEGERCHYYVKEDQEKVYRSVKKGKRD